MFGAFKPSIPRLGGLLWKIPWRLSAPQKLRHRRRLRRVDNIVAVLDTALKRNKTSQSISRPQPAEIEPETDSTTIDLPTTQSGQRLLSASSKSSPDNLRQGRGPKRGDILPGSQGKLLRDEAREQGTIKLIERWKAEMPTEREMLPKDKYTIYDRKARGYRKGVHKLPKWTRVSQRVNPAGF